MFDSGYLSNSLKIAACIVLFVAVMAPAHAQVTGRPTGTCTEWIDGAYRAVPCRPDPKSQPPPREEPFVPDPQIEQNRLDGVEQNRLGVLAWNNRDWAAAAGFFRRALEKDPISELYKTNLRNAEEQLAIEARRRLKEEADRVERERLRVEEQKSKDAAKLLKGIGSSSAFGIKGVDPNSLGLKGMDPRIDRDLSGRQAAWKQLNCSASILGYAISNAVPPPGKAPDFAESHFLLNEASNALSGQQTGVECASAPPLTSVSARTPDTERYKMYQRLLIKRAQVAVSKLEQIRSSRTPDENRIADALEEQRANEEKADKQASAARQQQRKINKSVKEPTVTPVDTAEKKAKREIVKIAVEAKEVEEGNLNFDVDDLGVKQPLPPSRKRKK